MTIMNTGIMSMGVMREILARPEALPRRGYAIGRALTIDGDVDPDKFMPWLNDYIQTEGASILRSKGILAFKDEPKRFVFQGVHMILDGDLQRDWKPDEKRVSRIVFIGRDLKEAEIRDAFLACAA